MISREISVGQPLRGRRIAIVGNSGSGKSTLARTLSERLCIPHVELDAINWRPGWVGLSTTDRVEWRRQVAEGITGEAWITDGNYSRDAQPQILARATDVIWLDYPRSVIMPRVLRRSLRRALDRNELWPGTGNRETFARWLDKEHPIRWTWDTFLSANAKRAAVFSDPALEHVRKHRFLAPRDTHRWLDQTIRESS